MCFRVFRGQKVCRLSLMAVTGPEIPGCQARSAPLSGDVLCGAAVRTGAEAGAGELGE